MATKTGMLLARASGFLENSLMKETKYAPRALVQMQHTRNKRRGTRPRSWQIPKLKVDSYWKTEHLTQGNKTFLSEVAVDKYKSVVESPLRDAPWGRNEWTARTMRTGLLGIKLGVLPQWTKSGKQFQTTLIQILDNHVIKYHAPEDYMKTNSYHHKKWTKKMGSVVVGALSIDPQKVSPQYMGLFKEAGVPPKRKITRFLVTEDAAIQPGTPLTVNHFRVGDYVDVQAKTIGHGFQGVVKRWGFKGGPASHGATKFQRRPGATGGGGDKAAIWKGKKLPGHMGMAWSTLRGIKIWKIDTKHNILYVHGQACPGPNHSYIRVWDTSLYYRCQEKLQNPPPMPTFYPDDVSEPLPEEIFDEQLYQFTDPTITFAEEVQKGKKR